MVQSFHLSYDELFFLLFIFLEVFWPPTLAVQACLSCHNFSMRPYATTTLVLPLKSDNKGYHRVKISLGKAALGWCWSQLIQRTTMLVCALLFQLLARDSGMSQRWSKHTLTSGTHHAQNERETSFVVFSLVQSRHAWVYIWCWGKNDQCVCHALVALAWTSGANQTREWLLCVLVWLVLVMLQSVVSANKSRP